MAQLGRLTPASDTSPSLTWKRVKSWINWCGLCPSEGAMTWKEGRALVSASGHDLSSRAHTHISCGEGKGITFRRAVSGCLRSQGQTPSPALTAEGLLPEAWWAGVAHGLVPCSQLHCKGATTLCPCLCHGADDGGLGMTQEAPAAALGSSWWLAVSQ